jgi:hypothetical protein
MKDEFSALFEAAKDLVTYIDKEHVLRFNCRGQKSRQRS